MGRLSTLIGLLTVSVVVLIYTWPLVYEQFYPLYMALVALYADLWDAHVRFFMSLIPPQ